MKQSIVIEFRWNNNAKDIEVPKDITANELINALNEGIGLGINPEATDFAFRCNMIRTDIRGDKTIEQIGLLDGYVVNFVEL